MTGLEHYMRAEELLSGLSTTRPDPGDIATAQVHAETLDLIRIGADGSPH